VHRFLYASQLSGEKFGGGVATCTVHGYTPWKRYDVPGGIILSCRVVLGNSMGAMHRQYLDNGCKDCKDVFC
jgi:hypothetical protein